MGFTLEMTEATSAHPGKAENCRSQLAAILRFVTNFFGLVFMCSPQLPSFSALLEASAVTEAVVPFHWL
jgi:hypothetical protein